MFHVTMVHVFVRVYNWEPLHVPPRYKSLLGFGDPHLQDLFARGTYHLLCQGQDRSVSASLCIAEQLLKAG